MARRRAQPRFDLALAARSAPDAYRQHEWLTEHPCTIAAAALARHPDPAAIEAAEVHALVGVIARAGRHMGSHIKVGGVEVYCSAREVRLGGVTLYHSPRMAGIFERSVPREPGAIPVARRMVEKALSAARWKGGPLIDVRCREDGRAYGFDSLEIVMTRPEGGGEFSTWLQFEHLPDAEREANVEKAVVQLLGRWRNRHVLAGQVHGAALWAREMAAGVEGMEFVGAEIGYVHVDKDKIQSAHVHCAFSHIGNTLERTTATATGHNDDQFKVIAARHRKGMKLLETGSALTVGSILAAAVRAAMPRHARGLLDEIEKVLDGRGAHPLNPVKRGISNFSMKSGRLHAPVTLARGVRLHKDRIVVKKIKGMPDAMLRAMIGRDMREVVDHPFLEGVTIRTATITTDGLNLRPDQQVEPLAPLVEELRRAVETQGEDEA